MENEALTLMKAGCYSLGEVQSLTAVPVALSRRYIKSYKGQHGLWGGREQWLSSGYYATFRDLIELRYINAFHEAGVTWRQICRTAEYAGERFGTDFPFSDIRFKTDGAGVFAAVAGELGAFAQCGQFAFEEIIGGHLFRPLDYEDGVPVRWYPLEEWGMSVVGRTVVVDPIYSFGVPVVVGCWIPAETLYSSFMAEGNDIEAVARHYEVSKAHVRCAVAFRNEMARRHVEFGR